MSMFSNGLLGLGGFGGINQNNAQMSLLGDYYDPEELQRQQMRQGLLAAGVSMLGQGPSQYPINFGTALGQGLGAGLEAANKTSNDYRQNAIDMYGINRMAESDAYNRERDAAGDARWQTQFDYGKQKDAHDFELRKQQIAAQRKQDGGYFGNPLMTRKPDGKGGYVYGYALAGKDGSSAALPAPDGVEFVSPYDKSFQGAYGKSVGDARGDAVSALPGQEIQSDYFKAKIGEIKNNPNLSSVTGWNSYRPDWASSNGMIEARSLLNEINGGAFMEARTILKGAGAITDFESKRAEAAYSRIETAIQSSDVNTLKSALDDLADALDMGMKKLKANAGQDPQAQPVPQGQPTQAPKRLRYNPETGNLE